MPIYRERILRIEAVQYHHPATAPDMVRAEEDGRAYVLTSLKNKLYLEPGDYIVTEADGKGHTVQKPEIFEARFEEI